MQPIPPRLKRTAALLVTSSALTAALVFSASAAESGTVTGSAQLMSEPSGDAAVVTTLAQGDALTVLDTDAENWYQVAYTADNGASLVGYLSTDAVSVGSPLLRTATVAGNSVRLRALPSTESDILDQLSADASVTLLDDSDPDWYQVAYGDSVGYIASEFVSPDTLASSVTVTTATLLRAAPDSTSDPLVLVSTEDTFDILAIEDGWYAVYCNGTTGYLEQSLVDAGEAFDAAANYGVVTAEDNLTLRADVSTDAQALTSLPSGAVCEYAKTADAGWYSVTFNGVSGYVSADYITAAEALTGAYAQVTVDATPVMAGAGTIFTQLDELEGGETVAVTGVVNGWYQVELDGAVGYIRPTDVCLTSTDGYADPNYPASSGGSAVVDYAVQFLGNPYVWGGTSLTRGADCSGFVLAVYSNFGVSLPHSSSAMRSCGYGVSYSDIQPGDIVCYNHHVGIYAGNGKIINALNSNSGIVYTDVNYKSILAIRRIF